MLMYPPAGSNLASATSNQTQQPETAQRPQVVKKGWIYKRGSSCYSRWKLKWAVLYSHPQIALYIFDKRDHDQPKYIIRPETIQIHYLEHAPKQFLESSHDFGFILSTRSRKFYLAAQNSADREEWMECLKHYSNPAVNRMNLQQQQQQQREYQQTMTRPFPVDMDDTASVYSAYSIRSRSSMGSRASLHSSSGRLRSRSQQLRRRRSMGLTFDDAPEKAVELMEHTNFEGIKFTNMDIMTRGDMKYLLTMNRNETEGLHQMQRGSISLNPMDPWDAEYQQLCSSINRQTDGQTAMNLRIAEYTGNFRDLAVLFGKKIIDQLHIRKNNANEDDMGLPETFIYGDILFHFAANYEEEDANAIEEFEKKTSNELKVIRAVRQAACEVNTALMCLIDYKGFRLVAYAAMPLEATGTMAYNLNSEKPVITADAIAAMNAVGERLNLKSHTVATLKSPISFNSETEVHRGKRTGQFYALNLSETFPVDAVGTEESHKAFRRFRSEFVSQYPHALPSEFFDAKSLEASQVKDATIHLRTVIVPKFVKKLDNLEILPIDSRGITMELHKHGINARYLGLIYKLTRLPYIRALCVTEMVARAGKQLFRETIRQAILQFRSVEASYIEDELSLTAVKFFQQILGSSEMQRRIWDEYLKKLVVEKFDIDIDQNEFLSLHKPALFISLQYHCGVEFIESVTYDFSDSSTLTVDDFRGFIVKSRCCENWIDSAAATKLSEQDRHVYFIAKQLLLQGPNYKFSVNNATAMKFNALAKFYNACDNFDLGQLYATAALRLVNRNCAAYALIYATYMESQFNLGAQEGSEKVNQLICQYKQAISIVEFHWGFDHPILMTLYDKMAHLLSRSNRNPKALEFIQQSLDLSYRILGKSHSVSAGYMTKAGYMLLAMRKPSDALELFTEALSIFREIRPSSEAVAENHFCMAEALYDKGDILEAIRHCEESKLIREKLYGNLHPKTIDSYQQMGKLMSANYVEYDGVITPQIRRDLVTSMAYYDKVFKFIKSHKDGQIKMFAGPKLKESILLTLTKTLIGLKLRMIPTRHRETVRCLRERAAIHSQEAVREVILKLVHLTPSVYLEELFQRLEGHDRDAEEELSTVLQIAESQQLAFA